jgi:hypothetical protein
VTDALYLWSAVVKSSRTRGAGHKSPAP